MTLYIYILSKTIQTIVARNRETFRFRELIFEDLAHFARYEDESVSALARHALQCSLPPTNWPPQRAGQPSNVPRPQLPHNQQRSLSVLKDVQSHSSEDTSIA